MRFMRTVILCVAVVALLCGTALAADQFKIALMQDEAGAAQKFQPLLTYLEKKGISATFVMAKDYPAAARMFGAGEVDAMFSGSGIAGSMIIKEVAYPVVRPVGKDGNSTYWAVVLAPKGSPKFTGSSDYFKGKKVIFCSLASSGEFYFHSVPGATSAGATVLKAASHGAAIDALSKGQADIAIVKNRVWDKDKSKAGYEGVEKVGEDKDANPDGTLIASNKADKAVVDKVSAALLAIEADSGAEAAAAKDKLNIKGYIKTTKDDFKHTLSLLKDAGVTKSFNFTY